MVASAVGSHHVSGTWIPDRMLQQGHLAMVELAGHSHENLPQASRFSDLPAEVLM
jgi:hypothetical protein